MKLHRRAVTVVAVAAIAGVLVWARPGPPPAPAPAAFPAVEGTKPAPPAGGALAHLPVSFVANQGRWDARAAWVAQGPETTAYFVDGGVRWALAPRDGAGWALDQVLVGARAARPAASAPAAGVVSYLGGDTPHPALPTATELTLAEAWPGVDVVWSGTGGRIEATYRLAPGADPAQIRVAWRGAERLGVAADGRLAVTTPVRSFDEAPPKAFQEVDGRRVPVEVSYAVDGDSYGFRLGAYDPARPLVIDPVVLLYAGFFGGNASDVGRGIAVDAAGNAYVVGDAFSTQATFPQTPGAFQPASGGSFDVFVAKVNPSGSDLVYATFFGGASSEIGNGIAVDAGGNAYITGVTSSPAASFPETPGAFQPAPGGGEGSDAFVAKLNPAGSALVYASYLGGSGSEFGDAIAVDAAGNAYVAGSAGSTAATFPETAGVFQPENAGGVSDGFVAKVNPAGSALVYASFIGGDSFDFVSGIAVDSTGNAYVQGSTSSAAATFPETPGAFQPVNRLGPQDAFVAKVNPTGSGLVYASFLGGDAGEEPHGIAVDAGGHAYVTGGTFSSEATFPWTPGVFQPVRAPAFDAYIVKVNPTGTGLVYASFLGGDGPEVGYGVAVDGSGNAYLAGFTLSSAATFPETAGVFQPETGGSLDAFVAKVNPAGSALVYATFLGGAGNETARAIAVGPAGDAFVTGDTTSPAATFPDTPGAIQGQFGGTEDAFVARIGEPASPVLSTTASAGGPVGTTSVTDTATLTGGFSPTGTVTFKLFSDNTCATQVFASTNAVAGGQATSGSFAPTTAGTYYWTAAYSGDSRNNPATSGCGAPNESVTITKAAPTLSTQASPGGLLGTPLRDVATLTGGVSATGTVTFRLFSDNGCTNQVFTSTNPLAGSTATSGWFTPAAAGTYWWTAAYAGDANNGAASSPCQAPNESAVITPFQAPAPTRTITGDLPGPVTVNAGESVLINGARVVGPVTVNPGGALSVVNSQVSRGIAANAPSFLSLCGAQVSAPSAGGAALTVSSAPVPIRIGDPASGCAGNRFAGSVTLTANLAVTFGGNTVSGTVTANNNGPGSTVVKANNVFQTLACAGNEPVPTNAGQVNTAASKTGQCAGL